MYIRPSSDKMIFFPRDNESRFLYKDENVKTYFNKNRSYDSLLDNDKNSNEIDNKLIDKYPLDESHVRISVSLDREMRMSVDREICPPSNEGPCICSIYDNLESISGRTSSPGLSVYGSYNDLELYGRGTYGQYYGQVGSGHNYGYGSMDRGLTLKGISFSSMSRNRPLEIQEKLNDISRGRSTSRRRKQSCIEKNTNNFDYLNLNPRRHSEITIPNPHELETRSSRDKQVAPRSSIVKRPSILKSPTKVSDNTDSSQKCPSKPILKKNRSSSLRKIKRNGSVIINEKVDHDESCRTQDSDMNFNKNGSIGGDSFSHSLLGLNMGGSNMKNGSSPLILVRENETNAASIVNQNSMESYQGNNDTSIVNDKDISPNNLSVPRQRKRGFYLGRGSEREVTLTCAEVEESDQLSADYLSSILKDYNPEDHDEDIDEDEIYEDCDEEDCENVEEEESYEECSEEVEDDQNEDDDNEYDYDEIYDETDIILLNRNEIYYNYLNEGKHENETETSKISDERPVKPTNLELNAQNNAKNLSLQVKSDSAIAEEDMMITPTCENISLLDGITSKSLHEKDKKEPKTSFDWAAECMLEWDSCDKSSNKGSLSQKPPIGKSLQKSIGSSHESSRKLSKSGKSIYYLSNR